MSWADYVNNLVDGTVCTDAVILSLNPPYGVWGAYASGALGKITPQEVANIVCQDRTSLFINGLCLAGFPCSLLRDLWGDQSQRCIDVRTKSCDRGATYNIHIVHTNQAIIILQGAGGVHGGQLCQKSYDTVKYLMGAGL